MSPEAKTASEELDEAQRQMLELLDREGPKRTDELRVSLGKSREGLTRVFETLPQDVVLVSVASLSTEGLVEITQDGRDVLSRAR